MLHDRARIYVEGGAGGNGVVSFRREAHVPRGGPDGGDGGHGGDVTLVCDPSRRDLAALRFSPHHRAGRGGHGQGKQRHGARGDDELIPVPPGTTAEGLEGERYDLVEPGQRAVVAHGGAGGHGNKRFANSTRQAPRFAERGLGGQSGWIELRLKLLADAGLVGLPNAGKSSLLGRLTRAAPKVAGYPFTTLEPVLGTIDDGERQLVLADIPGLIEGAAEGAGLGHEFLAHVERCRALVHLRRARAGYRSRGGLRDGPRRARGARCRARAVARAGRADEARPAARGGGRGVGGRLAAAARRIDARRARDLVGDRRRPRRAPRGALRRRPVDRRRDAARLAVGEPEFEAEHIVYRPQGDGGFDVEREGPAFRVTGRGVELLVARHDLSNLEALAYLEQRLREIGVIAALERAGFEPGDEVRIGDEEFELDPG